MHKPRKTIIIILSVIIALAAIIFTIFQIISSLKSSTVIIAVSPIDAKIIIDGQEYRNGIYHLFPKENVNIEIKYPNFESKTKTVNLEKNKLTEIFDYLEPNDNDWSFYEYKQNENSLAMLKNIQEYIPTTENYQKFIQKISLESLSPISLSICNGVATKSNCNNLKINYDYYADCGDKKCLSITGKEQTLSNEAINYIANYFNAIGYDFELYDYFYNQAQSK